ncbi:hypothetical protein BS78_02G151900 [Paspalum vaginatum]|nr:hypothetical protein BS78_02G151900 [Paspalum vaginatum]
MATERRRRSGDKKPKNKKASRKQTPATGPTSVHDVPDHVLELILLLLRSPACLLRAAASCKRWRRVVAAAEFLSRYGSLHAPSVVAGHYHASDPDWVEYGLPSITVTESPVFVPSPSLAVDTRRFSLDFLPDSDSGWAVADSRGSLLLLFKRRTGWAARAYSHSLPDLLVCEPLTRRYQGVLRPERACFCLGVFLLDGDGDGSGGRRIRMSNFRVVAVLHEYDISGDGRGTPVACVFSSGSDGGWRVQRSTLTTHSAVVSLPGDVECISFAGRANGSRYWVIDEDDGAMLVFDEATMEFSRVPFPTGGIEGDESSYDRWSFRVIGGDDGAPRVVRMMSNELMVLGQEKHHQGGGSWVVEKLVRLPEATVGLPGREDRFFQQNAMIVAAHDTYVLVTPQVKTWLISVELKTMHMEREHGRNKYAGAAYASELPWPPSFTACAEHSRRRR